MGWDPDFRAATLDHLLRGADSPREDAYFLHLTSGGAAVDTEVWTNYAPLELDTSAAATIFAAAAAMDSPASGRRSANAEEVEFQASATIVGEAPTVDGWEIRTTAEGGDRRWFGTAPPLVVQNEQPVIIPAGLLRIDFLEGE